MSLLNFRLFTESMDTEPASGDLTLEMTNRLFPLLGNKFQASVDPDRLYDGEDDAVGTFNFDHFQARLKEEVNSSIQEQGIEEHLVSLGIGIKSVNYQEMGGKHYNELYYDLVMEEDWQETVAEHIQNLRPATIDKHLGQLYKSSAGFISFMPKCKRDLLAAITDSNDEHRERGLGAFLLYLVGSEQVEEWGQAAFYHVVENMSAMEFYTPDEEDEDED